MKHTLLIFLISVLAGSIFSTHAAEWDAVPVPATPGSDSVWQLVTDLSDDFNYTFDAVASKTDFGGGKWYNFYHNGWDGPGTTYWKYNHVSVDGDNLSLRASRWDKGNQTFPEYPYMAGIEEYKMSKPDNGVNTGCVTSNARVKFPVYVEAAISVANISLASCFWLLSPSDKQEIDIIENYGGVDGFKQFTHISHHSFIRGSEPEGFHDYQPRDWNSWWPDSRVNNTYGWGDYCWNEGNRRYMRMGVYWIDPFHFEYYIDGILVRVMYYNAIATNMNGTWEYTYYNDQNPMPTVDAWGNNVGGMPTNNTDGYQSGYSAVTVYATGTNFSYATLRSASDASNGIAVVDPGNYQDGKGFTEELDIIINFESQSWLVSRGETPTDAELLDDSKNKMLIDWVRVYKPAKSTSAIAVTGVDLPQEIIVNNGFTQQLIADMHPSNATNTNVTWQSSAPGIASVDANGNVSGVSVGSAVITVTTKDGGHTAMCTVSVETFIPTDVTNVSLNKQKLIMAIGETSNLTATISPDDATNQNLSWESSSASVTVSPSGEVVAVSVGSAIITVTTEDQNKTASCSVSVVSSNAITVIEAEDLTNDGGDFDDGNGGGVSVNVGVGISYVNGGDWAEYTVVLPKNGKYAIKYTTATSADGTEIGIQVDGSTVAQDVVPNTGNFGTYSSFISGWTPELSAGSHTVRITTGTNDWQWNLDKIEFILLEEDAGLTASISLKKGWNLIGWPLSNVSDIETALNSIMDKVETVKDFDGFYNPTQPSSLNSLHTLQFGKGYFIKVTEDTSLSW